MKETNYKDIDVLYDIKLGELFKTKRLELHMTQEALSKKLNISISAISRYEKGERTMGWGTFKKYCEVLKVKPDKVVTQVFDACRQ